MNLNDIVKEAHATAVEKGWHQSDLEEILNEDLIEDEIRGEYEDYLFGARISLVHSEVSEALEAYREHGVKSLTSASGKPEGVMAELADVIIRVADLVGSLRAKGFEVDLEAAVKEKMAFNKSRPWRHGGKRL